MQDDTPKKRANLVTRERLLKGDLEISRDGAGYINQAHVKDDSILAYLIGLQILEYHHLSAASTYALWQQAFRKPFFAEPRKLYLIELLGSTGGGQNDESAYRKLLRLLNRFDQHNIEQAITAQITELNRSHVYACRFLFLTAFDMLIKAISDIEKQLEDIREREKTACKPR